MYDVYVTQCKKEMLEANLFSEYTWKYLYLQIRIINKSMALIKNLMCINIKREREREKERKIWFRYTEKRNLVITLKHILFSN